MASSQGFGVEDEEEIQERLLTEKLIIGTIGEGDERCFSKVITVEDIEAFAKVTGDFNPIHMDSQFAQKTIFGDRIAHGILSVGLISAALSKFPGVIVYLAQDIRFLKPVRPGDEIKAIATVSKKVVAHSELKLKTVCYNQRYEMVVDGEARVKVLDADKEAIS